MPDFSQPVQPMFIAISIAAIFVGVGIFITLVKIFKKTILRKQMRKKQKKNNTREA